MFRSIRIVEDWQGNALDVFMFTEPIKEGAVPSKIIRPGIDGWRVEELGENETLTGRPLPSLRIPIDVAEEVIAFMRKVRPSTDRDDAVKDARSTRDRLLAMIETTIDRTVDRPGEQSYNTTNYYEGRQP